MLEPQRVTIARGERHRLGREIRGHHAGAGALARNRERNAAGTGANLQHAAARFHQHRGLGGCGGFGALLDESLALLGRDVAKRRGALGILVRCLVLGGLGNFAQDCRKGKRGRIDALKGCVDQNLRLGARNEHPALAVQHDVAEGHLAGHVLQRLAATTTHHGVVHGIKLGRRERLVEVHVNLDAGEPGDVAYQPLCREPRMLVALALEVPARPLEDALYGPRLVGHSLPYTACASFSARSAAARASITVPS